MQNQSVSYSRYSQQLFTFTLQVPVSILLHLQVGAFYRVHQKKSPFRDSLPHLSPQTFKLFGFDFNLFWGCFFCFRECQGKESVFIVRIDIFLIHMIGKRE